MNPKTQNLPPSVPPWHVFRRTLWVLVPLLVYAGIYIVFSVRSYSWGGGFFISYPGLVRFYALSEKASASLGQSEDMIETQTLAGASVRQFNESLVLIAPGRLHHVWRVFYLAERTELALRRARPLKIAYTGPNLANSSTRTPSALPFLGPVFEDWCIRNGSLFRFVQGVYAARDGSNSLKRRNDVYLFEWSLDGTWDDKPRVANRARLVETNSLTTWEPHWVVDADHFITWNEKTGETRLLVCHTDAQLATVVANIPRLRPVRCNALSPISVSPTARFFAGESDGLTIFRADTFEVVHRVPESASTKRFFEKRPDELDNKNSHCFLMDDGATILRVVTIFKSSGDEFINGTTVVRWNLLTGEVSDIPVKVGNRADVHNAALVDGKLILYLTYTPKRDVWKQCLLNTSDDTLVEIHPANSQVDMVTMAWDPIRGSLVDLPGFPANPQPLNLESEVGIGVVGAGKTILRKLRYGDVAGMPALYQPGINAFRKP